MSKLLTIGDLARLGGTTTRTVRHYHQIGLLPEPARTAGGYRSYGAADLLALLKIRRLVSLGLPLQRIGEVLEADEVAADSLLAELDQELAARIAGLEAQRRVLALLRHHAVGPDVPEEFAPHLAALKAAGAPLAQLAWERDTILLLGSLGGAESLERTYRAQLSTVDMAAYVEISRKLLTLEREPPDAPVVSEVAAELVSLLEPLIPELIRSAGSVQAMDPAAEALLRDYDRAASSPAQARVFEIVAAEFQRRLTEDAVEGES